MPSVERMTYKPPRLAIVGEIAGSIAPASVALTGFACLVLRPSPRSSASELVDSLRPYQPDIVIYDIDDPIGPSWQRLLLLRERLPEARYLAACTWEQVPSLVDGNADLPGFLVKPLDTARIVAALADEFS